MMSAETAAFGLESSVSVVEGVVVDLERSRVVLLALAAGIGWWSL